MAITKERLEELIEQGATIYFIYNGNIDLKEGIYKDDFILNETYVSIYWSTRSHQVKYKNIFETKKDAEFVLKYHTTKTFKFEPPTWKDFLATRDEKSFAHWSCGDICVVMVEENNEKGILKTYNQFEVDIFNDYDSKGRKFHYINSYGLDDREEIYYKALEYAQEIFLGDSND